VRNASVKASEHRVTLGRWLCLGGVALGVNGMDSQTALAVAWAVVGLVLLLITAVRLNRMHEELQRSREGNDALIEQASEGILVADASERYTSVNEAICRMLGYRRDELLGKSKTDLLDPADLGKLEAHKARLLRGETVVEEWLLRRKDGTFLPVEVSSRILPDGRWQSFVRDGSERRRVQDELRRSMERFDLALRGADLAAWDWNLVTNEVIFNARWAEMRGMHPDEIRPYVDSWRAKIHPDDLPRLDELLEAHIQGKTAEYENEHRVMTVDGHWIWVLDRAKVLERDAAGRGTRMVGTELDVTARKRTEEALRLSEAKFCGIVTTSADAIVSLDEDQRITVFNGSAVEIFGHSREEALGRPFEILIPERLSAAYRANIQTFAGGDTPATLRAGGVIRCTRKSGEEFPAEVAASKIDVGGTRVVTLTIRDVTEQTRREMEKELFAEVGAALSASLEYEATSKRLADLLVRDLSDACIIDVVDENRARRRLAVACRDPAKAWICGAIEEIPMGEGDLSGAALDTREPVLFEHLSSETLDALAGSTERLRAIKALAPTSLIAVPLVLHSELLGVMTLIASGGRSYGTRELQLAVEIAQRTSLWLDNVRHYRAAQQAIRARDEVLGVVAHDLRNPLGTVLLQVSLLRRLLEQHGIPQRAADLIERSATRMNRLIQDLLDVTRLETHHLGLAQGVLSARGLITDAIESQKASVVAAGLDLDLALPDETVSVWGDRDRLLQVFENLVGNAVKFTQPGGHVIVGAAAREDDVLFWVNDTGIGIPAEHVPHVFDRFAQVRGAGRCRGAGLGLSIVKGIVEAHGGRVWVETTAGRGSTFFFTVPTEAGAGHRLREPPTMPAHHA
jgi:PAS domain S-box-containing protein